MTHCALVGVLCLAAFTSQPTFKEITKDTPPMPPLTNIILPPELTDALTHIGGGGGKPAAAPKKEEPKQEPVAQPPPVAAPQPVPEPVTPPKLEKPVEVPKAEKPLDVTVVNPYKAPEKRTKTPKPKPVAKPQDDEVEAPPKKITKTNEPKKVAVSLNPVVRNSEDPAKAKKAAEALRQKELIAQQEQYQKLMKDKLATIGKNIDSLNNNLSSGGGVSIDLPEGPGIGKTFVNYAQWVKEIYDRNWTVSDSVIGDDGIVRVEIVVQRNGTARGKIIKSSGNAALDRTVKAAIDRVSNIGYPFPAGSTDNTRTFIINFNLSSKRQTG